MNASPDGSVPPGLRGGLQVCGTTSDAGKSLLVTGLCRLLARQGVRVAPFKAQNMALNSAVTPDGDEIGRAQALQAEAAGVPSEAAMNPILLKPTGATQSQVVVRGRPWAVLSAAEYHERKHALREVVLDALEDLRARYDVVLAEGAGSPAEINLLDGDLANLWVAASAGWPALVVGDIDRGGVFASLYGTWALVPPEQQACIRGFVVNKFRGDASLLDGAGEQLEARTGVPTLGVLPLLTGLDLDPEDSLALDGPWLGAVPVGAVPVGDASPVPNAAGQDVQAAPLPSRPARAARPAATLDVAVVRFPRLANATDLDPLRVEPGVSVRLVGSARALGRPDLVILPGSKATVEDLAWLRAQELDRAVAARLADGATVLGICAGYQMLGRVIVDEVESGAGRVEGLGWLPVGTTFGAAKVLAVVEGTAAAGSLPGAAADSSNGTVPVHGYAIHHGRVEPNGSAAGRDRRWSPWITTPLGLAGVWGPVPGVVHPELGSAGAPAGPPAPEVAEPAVYGTWLHGLFAADDFRHRFLAGVARRAGTTFTPGVGDYQALRTRRLDLLADVLEDHLDLGAVWALVDAGGRSRSAATRVSGVRA